jgi:hypothetical protein|eukprot:4979093-Prymnesium_polylepis.1
MSAVVLPLGATSIRAGARCMFGHGTSLNGVLRLGHRQLSKSTSGRWRCRTIDNLPDVNLPLSSDAANVLQASFVRLLAAHPPGLHVDKLWPLYRKQYGEKPHLTDRTLQARSRTLKEGRSPLHDALRALHSELKLKTHKPDQSVQSFFKKGPTSLTAFLGTIRAVTVDPSDEHGRRRVHLAEDVREWAVEHMNRPFEPPFLVYQRRRPSTIRGEKGR